MSHLPCLGYHAANALWPDIHSADREMRPLPHLLLGAVVRGTDASVRLQDQQRKPDQVSAESEGDVRGPGEEPERAGAQRGRVQGLHGAHEPQPGRHPQVPTQQFIC